MADVFYISCLDIFRHITYCGPDLDGFVELMEKLGLSYVTYIEGMKSNAAWIWFYECVAQAMKLQVGQFVCHFLKVSK